MKAWRDLELEEEIKPGDRCLGKDGKWFIIADVNLEYQRHVTEYSRPLQREINVEELPAAEQRELFSLVDKAKEVASAITSVNRGRQHLAEVAGDDDPCYWQREEWIDWMLELGDELKANAEAVNQ